MNVIRKWNPWGRGRADRLPLGVMDPRALGRAFEVVSLSKLIRATRTRVGVRCCCGPARSGLEQLHSEAAELFAESWASASHNSLARSVEGLAGAAPVRKYPQVRRWIIISEPGNFYNLRLQGGHGRTAPHLCANLLDAAYASMHAVRPNAVVIGGGVHRYGLNDESTTAPDKVIANMLPNGRRPRLDLFAATRTPCGRST